MDYVLYILIDGRWLRADRNRKTPRLYSREGAEAEASRLTAEYGSEYAVVRLPETEG